MAQRVVVTLFDDIDGSEAAETIAFGVDGRMYEIDLNEANARKLRKALEPYVSAGRKRSRSGKAYRRRRSPPTRRRSAPGPRRTRWTCPRGAGSRRRCTRRSPRRGEPCARRAGVRRERPTAAQPPLAATDLRSTPGDQLKSGARRGARPKGPAHGTCGCSSVVEHPPSRGKAQCAIPVTRSAPPYRWSDGIR